MGKFLLGLFGGMILLWLFFFLGGPGYMKAFGAKTEAAAERLEKYEKKMKDTTKKTGESIKETAGVAKNTVDKTYDRTKEKVKEYMPK